MKAFDVVAQLQIALPMFTDIFTTDIGVQSITRSGTVMSVVCDAEHNLSVGHIVTITGAVVPIPISSLTRAGIVGTLVTSTPHDLTQKIASNVMLSGSVEAEFNGSFSIINIDNRNTIRFTMADSGATVATGSPVIENGESALRSYNQTFQVKGTPSSVAFEFIHSVTSLPDPTGTITIRANPRVTATVDFERAMAIYTKVKEPAAWMFVVLDDAAASKSRDINSDATDNIQRGQFVRQQVVQNFDLHVFFPVKDELAARKSRDKAEDLFRPICQSVLQHKFDSGLFVGAQNPLQFITHGLQAYNTATYVHTYTFQQTSDITFDDTVGHDLDVALRDIDLQIFPDPDKLLETISFLDVAIDLDEI